MSGMIAEEIPLLFNALHENVQKMKGLLDRHNGQRFGGLAQFDAATGRHPSSHVSHSLRETMRAIQRDMRRLIEECAQDFTLRGDGDSPSPRPVGDTASGIPSQEHTKQHPSPSFSSKVHLDSDWNACHAVQMLSDDLLWLVSVQEVRDAIVTELLLKAMPTAVDLIVRFLPMISDGKAFIHDKHLQVIMDRVVSALQPQEGDGSNVHEFACHLELLVVALEQQPKRLYDILPQPSVQCVYLLQITLPEGLASLSMQLKGEDESASGDRSPDLLEVSIWNNIRILIDVILRFACMVLEEDTKETSLPDSSDILCSWINQQLLRMTLDENTPAFTDKDAKDLVENLRMYFIDLVEYTVVLLDAYNERERARVGNVDDACASPDRGVLLHVDLAFSIIWIQPKLKMNADDTLPRLLWRSLVDFAVICKDSPALDAQSKIVIIQHTWQLTQCVVGTMAEESDDKPFVCNLDVMDPGDSALLVACVLLVIEYASVFWCVPAVRRWAHGLLEYERRLGNPEAKLRSVLQAAMLAVMYLPSSISELPSTGDVSLETMAWDRQDHMRSLIELSLAGNGDDGDGKEEKCDMGLSDPWHAFIGSQISDYCSGMHQCEQRR